MGSSMADRFEGKKVLVLGCPGSGKSTFAKKLADCTGLPLVHLDNIWWNPDRTHISRAEFDQKLKTILSEDQWIIDGNYSRTCEERIRACDTIFFLDVSEEECIRGITERIGTKRTDIPWIEEQLDPELAEVVQNYRTGIRPELMALFEMYPDRTITIFQTREEADAWIQSQSNSC